MRYVGPAGRKGKMRYAFTILVGKPEGKRPIAISRRSWENIVKTDNIGIGMNTLSQLNPISLSYPVSSKIVIALHIYI
jgi:hypothetical protein